MTLYGNDSNKEIKFEVSVEEICRKINCLNQVVFSYEYVYTTREE